jgi:DNA-directed RNA polymerase beta subunit
MIWDGDYEAEVVRAERIGKNVIVHLKTTEPAQIGSKISTRHSAKGIVTQIMDDKEMPHDEKGKAVEMLINPVSVPGRMNPGQLLETAAGKIAEKTGKPYLVKNFQGGVDYLKKVQEELKHHGLSDTDTLYDPATGRKLGDIMTGPHYAFQLEHQIDKKTHVRSGGIDLSQFDAPKIHYDSDTRGPRGGGHGGAQSLGSLGIYAALAAGLKDNLREMQTLKSDQPQAREVWNALANGERIPAPKIPFVFKKFEAMLTGMGVNVDKTGAEIRLMPRSDAETRLLSRGELTRPTRSIRGKDDKPEPGGLFDSVITGGPAGQHWGHIELVEPMPNPVYARAIAHTLGI